MKTAARQSFFRLISIVSVAVFVLGVLPCAAEAVTLGELQGGKEIKIGNLRFFNFRNVNNLPPAGTPPKAEMIMVEPVAGDNPGLRFEANGLLTVTAPAGGSSALERTSFVYDVETIDGSHSIKTNSQVLVSAFIDKGFGNTTIRETVKNENGLELGSKSVFFNKYPDGTEIKHLSVALDYSGQPLAFASIEVSIPIMAIPDSVFADGEASIDIFEQRFSLVSLADAGPDQLVTGDTATLDASASKVDGLSYQWEFFLKNGDDSDPLKYVQSPEAKVEVEVADLKPDLYLVRLTLTDAAGVEHIDTAIIAIAGSCESQPPSLPPANGKLHLWNFEIKKYKFCKWGFARVYGTVDASDLPLENSTDKDGLRAKVILQLVDKDGNTVGEYSDETAARIKDRRYKYLIRNRH